MTSQREAFLSSEGDRYFERNINNPIAVESDLVICAADYLSLKPKNILEIGCSNGWRLAHFRKHGARCFGVDPSSKAIASAYNDGMDLRVGTADDLPYKDEQFDFVIFGFCLYLVDPDLHFKCIAEADRVLRDGGVIAILDFLPHKTYYNDYSHREGLRSHKMQFANFFLASPAYSLVHRRANNSLVHDERYGVDFLLKDQASAFQKNL